MTGGELLEREVPLDEVAAALRTAREGRGRLVVVEAPAGGGKTAFLHAAADRARADAVPVLHAAASELEREVPFGLVRRLFGPRIDGLAAADRTRLLHGAAAPAAWALDDAGTATAPDGYAVLQGLYWLTLNLAAAGPLVLVADDLHWADRSSVRALEFLARRLGEEPIALVVALRPVEAGAPADLLDELRGAPEAVRIALAPLSTAAIGRLVATDDEDVAGAARTITGGNPLHAAELVRALDGAAATAERVRAIAVPTLGRRVLDRVERVDPEARALAQSMAVLSDGAALAAAAEHAGLPHERAGMIAAALRRIEVLAAEDPVAFVHPLVRRSIYDGLGEDERDAAHRRAAALLDAPEAVAVHLAALRPAGDPAVAAAAADEAARALARAAVPEAARWLERALEEQADDPPRWLLHHQLGMTLALLRDVAAVTHLGEAMERAPDVEQRAAIGVSLVEILMQSGGWEEGVRVTRRLTGELGDRAFERVVELAAIRATGACYDPLLRPDLEREWARHVELTEAPSWAAHALAATLGVVVISRSDDLAEGRRLITRALEDGRLFDEPRSVTWWGTVTSGVILLDDVAWARAVLDELARRARTVGGSAAQILVSGFGGWLDARTGDLVAAEAEIRRGLAIVEQLEMPMLVANGLMMLLDGLLERHDCADLAAALEAVELPPGLARSWTGGWLLEGRGRGRVARGATADGIADLRASGELADALGFGPVHTAWRSALALALGPEDRDEAHALAAAELAWARRSGLPRAEGVALRTVGVLEQDAETLEAAVARLEASPARLELARALLALGEVGGDRATLERAADLALACGADRLLTRANAALRAAGGRPRRAIGPATLTAGERRVADLAAAGATNAEIAQELFVTRKTVETHLSNAYAKLGLSGRGARERLAGALATA